MLYNSYSIQNVFLYFFPYYTQLSSLNNEKINKFYLTARDIECIVVNVDDYDDDYDYYNIRKFIMGRKIRLKDIAKE